MKCPNCSSSRVRKAKRSLAEKIFLPLLLTRPFRCEDCVARFFSFIWSSAPNFSAPEADSKSRVYHSSTAALHSQVYRSRRGRRLSGAIAKTTLPIQPEATPASSEATQLQHASQSPKAYAAAAGASASARGSAPPDPLSEILGIILEIKPGSAR